MQNQHITFTPHEIPSKMHDKIMLMLTWAKQLNRERQQDIIIAGIGHPTFPISPYLVKSIIEHWQNLSSRIDAARNKLSSKTASHPETQEYINQIEAVVSYNDPQGDFSARSKIALAMQNWYGNEADITADHILFTTGGAGGLYCIFDVINYLYPNNRILTPMPFYPLYQGSRKKNNLFFIDITQKKSFRLTGRLLETSIKEAYKLGTVDGKIPIALVLCNPNNPLGTVISQEEAIDISQVLKKYPDLWIILDEAYAEMNFSKNAPRSLLSVAPELKHRMIILRSATKAFSASGERMAITIAFDKEIMEELIAVNIDICGHPPVSLQHAYSEALLKLDEQELEMLTNYYASQVYYAQERLEKMNANICNQHYQISGTFYILANLSELIGTKMSVQTFRAIKALDKNGQYQPIDIIQTDEDIAYTLLFEDNIMLTPCSYLGLSSALGYLRITCSSGIKTIKNIMDVLENRLKAVREARKQKCLETMEVFTS